MANFAAFFAHDDEIKLQDQHVETLNINDEPDLVMIEVYVTNAYRAYKIADHYRAKGAYVILGGLHVTSLKQSNKNQNLAKDYSQTVKKLHSLGIMINGSFVFGLDDDDCDVFRTKKLSEKELEAGYQWAYKEFYTWSNTLKASFKHESYKHKFKHLFYTGGWKKFERSSLMWSAILSPPIASLHWGLRILNPSGLAPKCPFFT